MEQLTREQGCLIRRLNRNLLNLNKVQLQKTCKWKH